MTPLLLGKKDFRLPLRREEPHTMGGCARLNARCTLGGKDSTPEKLYTSTQVFECPDEDRRPAVTFTDRRRFTTGVDAT